MAPTRIVYVVTEDWYFLSHRLPMARAAKAAGYEIHVATRLKDGEAAIELAVRSGKDPRLVELILRESEEVSRVRPGVLIVRHRLGFTCANAGIDRSNIGPDGEERVLLLPIDPDTSARRIRRTLAAGRGVAPGVVITDSHGRPFRLGTVGVAIGAAGLPALWDRRGEPDRAGAVGAASTGRR